MPSRGPNVRLHDATATGMAAALPRHVPRNRFFMIMTWLVLAATIVGFPRTFFLTPFFLIQ